MSEWQPIETAPKESRIMFVVKAFNVAVSNKCRSYTSDPYCVWRGAEGSFVRWPHSFEPTHWLELPEDI